MTFSVSSAARDSLSATAKRWASSSLLGNNSCSPSRDRHWAHRLALVRTMNTFRLAHSDAFNKMPWFTNTFFISSVPGALLFILAIKSVQSTVLSPAVSPFTISLSSFGFFSGKSHPSCYRLGHVFLFRHSKLACFSCQISMWRNTSSGICGEFRFHACRMTGMTGFG